MPNWCHNSLDITGEEKDIISFLKKFTTKNEEGKDRSLDLEKIIKTPKELLTGEGWYDWRHKNWGTKWNIIPNDSMEREPGSVIFVFDSAWAPCDEAIKKLSKKCPELTMNLEYCEPGIMFAGRAEYKGGETISEYKTENPADQIFKDFGYGDLMEQEDEVTVTEPKHCPNCLHNLKD